MRIATNVTREFLGGITTSNISFLNFLHNKGRGVIGIELNSKRHTRESTAFSHLSSDWFHHHIVNMHDIPLNKAISNSKSLADLIKKYRPIINEVKSIFKKDRPDIVFLNGTYYMPWLISIAAHELKIPIVLRYAGIYTKETENAKNKARKFFNEIEKSFQRTVSYFIFPSRLCQTVVEKEVINKKIKRSSIVPNPINLPSNNSTLWTTERRIAAVGRWDRIKNFETFFKIHKKLLKSGWHHEASFVTSEAKIKSMPKSINLLSSMNHEEITKFYTAQGLIICPSHFETFGNVPIEAACMGVPVLVSENMGCAEILKNAGLGNMVISFDDMDKVVERVKNLCGQQILPKQINNLRKVLDAQVINAEINSILRSVVEGK